MLSGSRRTALALVVGFLGPLCCSASPIALPAAFVISSKSRSKRKSVPNCNRLVWGRSRHPLLHMKHTTVDDDDVSQHEFMVSNGQNQTSSVMQGEEAITGAPRRGYRPIEDWHDDHIAENPEEHNPLTHLKREKARWGKAFESMGGDGI